VYCWPNGCTYEGEWLDNKMHGAGTFKWPDGKSFVGIYVKDKKHGPGTLTLPDGTKLSGKWIHGKMQGVSLKEESRGSGRRPQGNDENV